MPTPRPSFTSPHPAPADGIDLPENRGHVRDLRAADCDRRGVQPHRRGAGGGHPEGAPLPAGLSRRGHHRQDPGRRRGAGVRIRRGFRPGTGRGARRRAHRDPARCSVRGALLGATLLFLLAYFGVAVAFSAFSEDSGRALAWAMAVFILFSTVVPIVAVDVARTVAGPAPPWPGADARRTRCSATRRRCTFTPRPTAVSKI